MTRVWQWFVHAPGETVQFWREPRDPFILGVFLGVLAILAVYHLLLSLSLHDRGCLAYALVLGSFIGVLAIAEGLVYRHLLGERLALVNNLLALGCALLLLIWMTQFSRIIFATKRELPTADRLLVGLIVFDTANLLLWVTILTAVRSTYLVQFLLPLISVPHGALLLTVGIIAAVRRAPFAGLYLAGWVLVFAGSWLQLLREDQVLADNLATRYAIYWGVLGQICCLSLAVSIRLDRLRHHREQQMRKLMEADKLVSIGTMAASLSHEIANPTSAIAANAAFLRTYYEHVVPLLDRTQERTDESDAQESGRESDQEGARESVREIDQEDADGGRVGDLPYPVVRDRMRRAIAGIVLSADRITGIIAEFRRFYRRTRVEHTERVDLNGVVDAALVVFGHVIRRHHIPLRTQLARSLPPVAGNTQQLEQVLVNLLSNAVEAIRAARGGPGPRHRGQHRGAGASTGGAGASTGDAGGSIRGAGGSIGGAGASTGDAGGSIRGAGGSIGGAGGSIGGAGASTEGAEVSTEGAGGITITTRTAAGGVELEVTDDGVGMAPATVKRLGEAFFSTHQEDGGTGLGLYVCHHIMGEHSGTLSFASQPGAGTTATARLPVAATAANRST